MKPLGCGEGDICSSVAYWSVLVIEVGNKAKETGLPGKYGLEDRSKQEK